MRLYKASKIYGVPLTHSMLDDINEYDLILLEYLELFKDPKVLEKFKNTFIDSDFDEYVRETDNMANSEVDSVESTSDTANDEWEEV